MDHAGHRTRGRVTWESWSTPQALGPERESPGRAGRHRGMSESGASLPGQLVDTADLDPCLSRPGQLVDHEGPQNGALITRESWSSMQNLRHGPELLGKPCRRRGPSYLGPTRPGQLVDPGGNSDHARVASEGSSTPRALRTVPSPPGQMVDTAGPRTRARIDHGTWSTPRAPGHGPDCPGELVYPAVPRT